MKKLKKINFNYQVILWTQLREAALHLGLEAEEITEEEVT